jgi:hypothetical protein
VRPAAVPLFAPLQKALEPIGASVFQQRDVAGAADLNPLEQAGVPVFEPLVDNHFYFDYHHTPADTLDKVNPYELQRHVAVLSALSWYLANIDQPIGRNINEGKAPK